MQLGISGESTQHFHGVGVGPLSKILAVKPFLQTSSWSYSQTKHKGYDCLLELWEVLDEDFICSFGAVLAGAGIQFGIQRSWN